MNKKYMIGAILVLLISTFALGCIGSKQTVAPTPTETPQVTETVAPIGTTEQVTPVGTTEQITPVGTTMPNATVMSTTTPMPTATTMSVAIEIKNSAFNPLRVTIPQGTTVTWTNNDTVAHTVTSVTTGVFDSGSISPGTTYSYTFSQAGIFGYSCTIHPSIPHGTITVTSTGVSAPTPTSTAMLTSTPTPTVTATSTATTNTTP